jgi:hypothetical protein
MHAAESESTGPYALTPSVAGATALEAVNGVAVKVMVDRWAAASGDAYLRAFEAAFAVRQIEVGLAPLLSIVFGLAVSRSASACCTEPAFHIGSAGSAPSVLGSAVAGVAQAYTGFSPVAMMISMTPSSVLLFWASKMVSCMIGVKAPFTRLFSIYATRRRALCSGQAHRIGLGRTD